MRVSFLEPGEATRSARRASAIRTSLLLSSLALLAPGCSSPKLAVGVGAFRVTFEGKPDVGSAEKPLTFSVTEQHEYTVTVEALRNDEPDALDETFNGWVVLTAQPSGKLNIEPMAVELKAGRATGVKVAVSKAYGPVRLVASDPGYVPAKVPGEARCNADPGEDPYLADDDNDGFPDYPLDRGCYYGNDETETGGTGATGASPIIYFANPRLADVQRPAGNGDHSGVEGSRVTVDKGFLVVSRVSSDGMYVTDYDTARWDTARRGWTLELKDLFYKSVFVFNFSSPINIQEGDCLVQVDGAVEEFYGFTEMSKPTWKKGDYPYCAALLRDAGMTDCPVTEAADPTRALNCRQQSEILANTPFDIGQLVFDEDGRQISVWDQIAIPGTATERFEAALVQVKDLEMFTKVQWCDRNGNNTVDFSDPQEKECSNTCGEDPLCIVGETYDRYKQWTVHFKDGLPTPVVRELTVVTQGAIPKFDPLAGCSATVDGLKTCPAKKLGLIVGTLRHLSFGRPPWTLEPRRPADCPDCKN